LLSPEAGTGGPPAGARGPGKIDPLGVFLANHWADTGMRFWPRERWRREIQNLKRMGARSVWYLPMQFGERERQDFGDDAPYWILQRDICRTIAEAGLTVGIYVGLNDIFPETVDANPAWKAIATSRPPRDFAIARKAVFRIGPD
jgi:hypothetical protein